MNAIITWRMNVETSIFISNEIAINQIKTIETIETISEEERMTTTMTTTTMLEMKTTKMQRNFTNCTLSCFSRHYQQWASCSLKQSFEFWTACAFSITFEKSRRLSRTRRSINSSRSMISRNQFTSWNKELFAWFARSTANEWTFHFRTFFTFRSAF
jgi:hypothetical protein